MGNEVSNPHNVPIDNFFEVKKEKMLEFWQTMGLDFFACQDFIDTKGLVSFDTYIMEQQIKNPNYQNPLKVTAPKQI